MKKIIIILFLLPLGVIAQSSLAGLGKRIIRESTDRLAVEAARKTQQKVENGIRNGVKKTGEKITKQDPEKKRLRKEKRAWKRAWRRNELPEFKE